MCTKCLESMESFTKDLADLSLQDRYDHHLDRWKKLKTVIDNIHQQLKQLPERWKEYNHKLVSVIAYQIFHGQFKVS